MKIKNKKRIGIIILIVIILLIINTVILINGNTKLKYKMDDVTYGVIQSENDKTTINGIQKSMENNLIAKENVNISKLNNSLNKSKYNEKKEIVISDNYETSENIDEINQEVPIISDIIEDREIIEKINENEQNNETYQNNIDYFDDISDYLIDNYDEEESENVLIKHINKKTNDIMKKSNNELITINPEPTDPEPIDQEPIDSEPMDPEPMDPELIDQEPMDSEPIDPEPTDPEPIDPEPIDPEPIDPESTELEETEEIYYIELDDGSFLNISDKLKQTKIIAGKEIQINVTQVIYIPNKTILYANAKNIGGETTNKFLAKITYIDKNGGYIGNTFLYIKALQPNQEIQISGESSSNFINSYDIKIE